MSSIACTVPSPRFVRAAVGLTGCVVLALSGGRAAAADIDWQWPLSDAAGAPAAVVRGFDPPATRYGPGHRGVDLAAPVGRPVTAAGGGVVSVAGDVAGRGVVVVVHGDLRTTYEPVSATVRVGTRVDRGQQIGTLLGGHPDCRAASACLHWGLLRGADYLDPLALVRSGPARLLPIWASSTSQGAAASTATGAEQPASASFGHLAAAAERPDDAGELPGPAPADSSGVQLSARLAGAAAVSVASLLGGVILLLRASPRGPLRRPPGSRGALRRRLANRIRRGGAHEVRRSRRLHPAGGGGGEPTVVDLDEVRMRRREAADLTRWEPG